MKKYLEFIFSLILYLFSLIWFDKSLTINFVLLLLHTVGRNSSEHFRNDSTAVSF